MLIREGIPSNPARPLRIWLHRRLAGLSRSAVSATLATRVITTVVSSHRRISQPVGCPTFNLAPLIMDGAAGRGARLEDRQATGETRAIFLFSYARDLLIGEGRRGDRGVCVKRTCALDPGENLRRLPWRPPRPPPPNQSPRSPSHLPINPHPAPLSLLCFYYLFPFFISVGSKATRHVHAPPPRLSSHAKKILDHGPAFVTILDLRSWFRHARYLPAGLTGVRHMKLRTCIAPPRTGHTPLARIPHFPRFATTLIKCYAPTRQNLSNGPDNMTIWYIW